MSRDQGYRPLHTCAEAYQQAWCDRLGLETVKVPSHSTLRRVITGIDVMTLNDQLEAWMLSQPVEHSPDSQITTIEGNLANRVNIIFSLRT